MSFISSLILLWDCFGHLGWVTYAWGMDKGKAALLVLLDLSAAFHTTDYSILLDRMARLATGDAELH